MAGPYRIKALTRKPTAGTLPSIGKDFTLVIDLDGYAKLYLQYWDRNVWGQPVLARRDQYAIESLSTDYALELEPEGIPDKDFRFFCTGIYHDDALGLACQSLLQLGIKARIVLNVAKGRPPMVSFGIATDRPAGHVLHQYFPRLGPLVPRDFRRMEAGHSVDPLVLTRFHFPAVPGVPEKASLSFPLPPLEAPVGESLQLGSIVASANSLPIAPAHLPLERFTRGTLVAGTTGSGKTNSVLNLVQSVEGKASVLVLDVKREYRCLHRTQAATVLGFSGRNLFTHNLVKPVGPPALWVKQFSEILSEVISRYVPAVGSKDVVAETLDRLYRERGVYEGSVAYPHIGDLLAALEERADHASAREGGWLASALRVLRSLMIGSTRQAFCVREGLALERLLAGVTVLELDGIGDKAAESLLASVLLQKIRNKLQDGPMEDRLRHVIVIEEAQHLLAQGQEATSILTTTCREIRAYGVGLVYVTQMPSEFSKHALANVNTILSHKLVHPSDRSAMSSILGLDADQKEILERLPIGVGILRTDHLALVRVPEAPRPRVLDEELGPVVVERREVAMDFAQRAEAGNRAVQLRAREWEVFRAIAEAKAVHPSGLKDFLGRSHREVSNVLGLLIRKGLVAYCPARRNGHGKPRLVHFPTPMGLEAYRGHEGRHPDRNPAPGAPHQELVALVLQALEIRRKPHARFDILYDEDGRERVIEAETGSNNDDQLRTNLEKMVEFQGEARFVAADEVVRDLIVQTAARWSFDRREGLLLRIATPARLPSWDTFDFQPIPITP